MNIVGRKIRLLRHCKGWTQEEIAVRLGLTPTAFSKIEAGICDISLSRLEQIAELFDLSVIQILMLDDHAQQQSQRELKIMNRLLDEREKEVINLQKKVIELYEELRARA